MADAKAAAASAADDVVMPAVEGFTPELLPDKDRVYYNDYSTLVQQQGMLQDHVRTSLYQFSMLENVSDFAGKTVLDVGAGTGILSFFAAKAGAEFFVPKHPVRRVCFNIAESRYFTGFVLVAILISAIIEAMQSPQADTTEWNTLFAIAEPSFNAIFTLEVQSGAYAA